MSQVEQATSNSTDSKLVVDPTHPANVECPFPLYKHLRESAPVAYVADHDFYMVTGYDLCKQVLRDPKRFRQWDGDEMFEVGEGPPLGRPSNWSPQVREAMEGAYRPVSTLVNANPPRHTRYRKLATSLFSARRTADAMEARMQEIVDELIDGFPADGQVEFVSAFAVPFPLRVISEVLGLPASEYPRFKHWTDSAMVAIAGGVTTDRLVTAAHDLHAFQDYLLEMVEERRSQPADDMLGYLAHAKIEDTDGARQLTPEETIGLGLHLLTGGGETTTNLLGSLLHRLVTTPGLITHLQEHPEDIPTTIEETLRMDSPFQALFRRTTRATRLGDVELPEGAKVLVTFGAANRDETTFNDAETFNPHRTDHTDHIAFGFGTHFCLGAPLARREALIATEKLINRLPNLHQVPGTTPTQNPHAFLRGLSTLDLGYTRVEPRRGDA